MVHDAAMDPAPTLQDLALSSDEEEQDDVDSDELCEEYEVEEILRYRRLEDGEEFFLVKWLGFPQEEATWEPANHMNENCRELIVKARALFAWRKPQSQETMRTEMVEDLDAEEDAADGADNAQAEDSAVSFTSLLEQAEVIEEVDDDEQPDPLAKGGDASPALINGDAAAPDSEELPPLIPEAEISLVPNGTAVNGTAASEASSEARHKRAAAEASLDDADADGQAAKRVARGTAENRHPAVVLARPAQPTPERIVAQPEPPKEMKCMCGSSEMITRFPNPDLVVCKFCNCALHVNCVRSALGSAPTSDYACPPCRVERVDDFHPPVGPGLLRYSYAQSSSTVSLSFQAQASQWRKQQWSVHLRAVNLNSTALTGPAWPHRVQGKLNGRQAVTIDPPKHLHVRREQCYNLTPLLRQGLNTMEIRLMQRPDKPRHEPDEEYCIGVVLTRPRTVASIVAKIRNKSHPNPEHGRARVAKLLESIAPDPGQNQDDCMVSGDFGRRLKPICPISHCPIGEAAIGRYCNHIQVFDLQSYVTVNQRMRSLDKRWTCPVCSAPLRPDDVVLEPWVQEILNSLKGQEDDLEAVVFNDDCSYTTISVEQAKEEREAEQAEKGMEEVILSDSE
mmetsp:Transcript_56302/g.134207  ORF Transcript_56302/g.134207 Transcript_56302/m.134207 type:complete len:623 (+) Transcript_56302:46-1914(+)